ncbi:uncharacterized protein LOC132555378 [Ylistrum balloti]|uniref:uncharacterized protein LOC132555378 n=1 Tax=Ylistrum balloti TaxID=509963 RepID=UPI002905B4F4|nr:uncharacterized protein LOC132555378 [Ylistrum balloti]
MVQFEFSLEIICLYNARGWGGQWLFPIKGNCRQKPQLQAANTLDPVSKSPCGLQQCERDCFSNANCVIMVFHIKSLECYTELTIDSVEATGSLDFVVKLRHQIASELDASYLCNNHQCESGHTCIGLSSGVHVCMAMPCGQPLSIANADVNVISYSISSTASYYCHIGYNAVGTMEVTCQPSLKWTDTSFICIKNGFSYDQGTQMIYQIFTSEKTYSDAKSHCANLGSELVKINTTERVNVLSSYLNLGQFYTDASDLVQEGTWIFSDGSNVDMTLFSPAEPDGGTNENCAIFGYTAKLHDVICSTTRLFICEIR